MRLSASAIALVVGLMLNHAAHALQLPQRWVSAGGVLPSIGYQRQLSAGVYPSLVTLAR